MFQEAVMITSFVAVMMVLVEYVNVRTKGTWNRFLKKNKASQYLLSFLLGAIPGCLGSFVIVTLYTHKLLSVGALVAGMITTIGDEAFIVLAKSPGLFFLLGIVLGAVGIVAGVLSDFLLESRNISPSSKYDIIPFHEADELSSFNLREIKEQLSRCIPSRGFLATALLLFLIADLSGQVGPDEAWARITLAVLAFFALVIVLIVPDHFLEEHIWAHVAKVHVPRIFLWTLGAMVALSFIPEGTISGLSHGSGALVTLFIACLVGIIPESGPHIIFILLYLKGDIPLSILIASSIVQDGHGMLPLLAHSRLDFILVKGINLVAGLTAGIVLFFFGV